MIEVSEEQPHKRPAVVGIDIGLNRLATLSTGKEVENQAFLKTTLKKLRQANEQANLSEEASFYTSICARKQILMISSAFLHDSQVLPTSFPLFLCIFGVLRTQSRGG